MTHPADPTTPGSEPQPMPDLSSSRVATPAPSPLPPVEPSPPELGWGEPSPFARKGHPAMGLSLWVFGAALWAYTVLGELVVSLEIPEFVAWVALAVAIGQNWRSSVRHIPRDEVRRRFEPLASGLGLGLVALLVCAVFLGTHDRSGIEAVTLALWVLSLLAYGVGRYWAATPKARASGWARAGGVAAWTVTVVATVVAHLSVLHNL